MGAVRGWGAVNLLRPATELDYAGRRQRGYDNTAHRVLWNHATAVGGPRDHVVTSALAIGRGGRVRLISLCALS